MFCLLITVHRSRTKMKTTGDIFTASSMGWGWVNIALTLQISCEGGGDGWEEKNVCAQTGVLRAEGNFSNLFARTYLTLKQ